ncbi:MAG: PHP domain-containing protein, partial [Anaerolineae bacterium]|nr:PHP domain-containing protein [Anaerolineae bacterium]
MGDYVELHCHSCFSLLDGASTPEALLDRALALQMDALALTDHNGLYGAVRFAIAAQERGLRAITGAEVTLENGQHLGLLAENRTGYRNLCWLISRAQLGGGKGHARLPLRLLGGRTTGLIALTGCRQGWVAGALLASQKGSAIEALRTLQRYFGPRHLFIELQKHHHREDDALVAELLDLANGLALPVVATNNVHYALHEDHELHDTLVAVAHNTTLPEAHQWLRANSEYYIKSAAEMRALFPHCPQAIDNTLEIAERCQLELNFRSEALPPQPLPNRQTADELLAMLCQRALPQRYPHDMDRARQQLHHELGVIRQTRLA